MYFNFIDFNNDNQISQSEIEQSLNIIFQLVDFNQDGFISKSEINELSDEIEARERSLASVKRARLKEKKSSTDTEEKKEYKKVIKEVKIPEQITIQELSNRMAEKSSDGLHQQHADSCRSKALKQKQGRTLHGPGKG